MSDKIINDEFIVFRLFGDLPCSHVFAFIRIFAREFDIDEDTALIKMVELYDKLNNRYFDRTQDERPTK